MLLIKGGESFISDNFEGIGLTENLESLTAGDPEYCGFNDDDYDQKYYEDKW